MPIYEFTCKNCNRKFEVLCKAGETGKSIVCKHCGTVGVTRAFSRFAAHVKDGDGETVAHPNKQNSENGGYVSSNQKKPGNIVTLKSGETVDLNEITDPADFPDPYSIVDPELDGQEPERETWSQFEKRVRKREQGYPEDY